MLKFILIFLLVMMFGVSLASAQQTLSADCDPYHIGQSDFSIDTSALNALPESSTDAAVMSRIGINPQVLVKLADNVSGRELPVADFANPGTQLNENDFAFVTTDSTTLKLYSGTCLEAPILAQLQPGTQVTVLDGPIAAEGLAWWRVRRSDLTGWVIEGVGGDIWLHG
jgi:hypothetical protein